MKKKILSLLIAAVLVISVVPHFAFANEAPNSYIPIAENYDSSKLRVPNAISIAVEARQDGTGVDVKVENLGADGLDSVTVTVIATGHSSKSQTAYVPAIIGKTFSFNFPFIDCNTTYDATIRVIDGSGNKTLTGQAKLTYSESMLASAGWHKGTFATRGASLEYHLDTHGAEVGCTNLVQYLDAATSYRDQVVYDIGRNNLSNYKITIGTGSIASHKYKSLSDGRFALLADSSYELLSFGI